MNPTYQIRVIAKLPNSEQSYKNSYVYKQTKSVINRKTVNNESKDEWE